MYGKEHQITQIDIPIKGSVWGGRPNPRYYIRRRHTARWLLYVDSDSLECHGGLVGILPRAPLRRLQLQVNIISHLSGSSRVSSK